MDAKLPQAGNIENIQTLKESDQLKNLGQLKRSIVASISRFLSESKSQKETSEKQTELEFLEMCGTLVVYYKDNENYKLKRYASAAIMPQSNVLITVAHSFEKKGNHSPKFS